MAMARLNRRVLVSKTMWGGVVFADVIVMLFGAAAERENKSSLLSSHAGEKTAMGVVTPD